MIGRRDLLLGPSFRSQGWLRHLLVERTAQDGPPNWCAEFLFGSCARGDAKDTSDIDIGILGPQAVDYMILLRIKGEVRAIPTLRRVDVVDLTETDESFREEVLSYARGL